MKPILVFTSFPDKEAALKLSTNLIEEGLAACVNILNECSSVYSWQGSIETVCEVPVLIKTQVQHYAQVERRIKAFHPYELPEVMYVSISGGLPAYLQWIENQTALLDVTKKE